MRTAFSLALILAACVPADPETTTSDQEIQTWEWCDAVVDGSECYNPASNFPVAPYSSSAAHDVCVDICGTRSSTGTPDTRQNATTCSMYAPDGNHVYGRCTRPTS